MTQLFIAHADTDTASADQIRRDLAAHGYTTWHDATHADPASISYSRAIETGIRGSAALLLIWSAAAAGDEWVERQVLFAQRLHKSIAVLLTDSTDLPITLINVPSVASPPPCGNAVAQLLPQLPPPDQDDLLLTLLTHDYIRERKAGIQRAAELLQQGQDREHLMALLEDIARHDLFDTVREVAQAVLDAQASPNSAPIAAESRHIFGARCTNGHITYFDKRAVCSASGMVKRNAAQRAGKELAELYLTCDTCGEAIAPLVDCEGYT